MVTELSEIANVDVLIIGYGPAGATMANLLGKRGYSVAIFDQNLEVYDKPRAITADQEALRVFQECGLADEIAGTVTPHPGTDFLGVDGQLIKYFYPAPPPEPLAWLPAWMFVQPEMEASLRRGVSRYPHVHEYLGHEFLRYDNIDSGVTATIKRLSDGAILKVHGKYMIGCDGGRSAVRRQMASPIEDLGFDEWWIVVDAWMRGPIELPPRCVQYCRPSRPGTYIVGPGDLRRWEIKMLPGETPETFSSNEAIMSVLSTFVDIRHLELCRSAIYRFHALVINNWRDGRVFLMGDAAHQMPPFLGQGLCAAIRDTVNLAWKIDGVERLGYPETLLDTYVDERKRHVRTIVGHAKSFGLIIGELDEVAARKRDQELVDLLASGKMETIRQKFIPGLEVGLIGVDAHGNRAIGAGELCVQPWIHEGAGCSRMDDLVPTGFLVLSDDFDVASWLDSPALRTLEAIGAMSFTICTVDNAARLPKTALVARDGLFHDWITSFGARAVVVRPDRYVYGMADNLKTLRALISGLGERLAPGVPHPPSVIHAMAS